MSATRLPRRTSPSSWLHEYDTSPNAEYESYESWILLEPNTTD